MRNRALARVLLILGFVAATVAYGGWISLQTVLDPGSTGTVARNVITTPVVQNDIAKQLEKQVDADLQSAHASVQVQRAVDTAVRDPRVADAFAEAISEVQRALLSDSPQTLTINSRALTSAVHDALARIDPALAARLAHQAPISATIDASKVPNLRTVHRLADLAVVLGILAALACIGGALVFDHSRKGIGRTGRRVAYLSIAPILAFVVLPAVIGSHGLADVVRVVLDAYAPRVVPSAAALLVAGVLIFVGSRFMPDARRAAASQAASYTPPPARAVSAPPDPLSAAVPPRLGETLRL